MSSIEVIPSETDVADYSQAKLGDIWWQTVYKIPVTEHFGLSDDKSDPNGRRGAVEKALKAQFEESVLFIGGAFGEITNQIGGNVTIDRTIVLPNEGNATVFFPLINAAFDNLINTLNDPNNLTGNLTVAQLQELASSLLNTTEQGGLVSELFASVDSKPVTDLVDYRQASGESFNYTTPYPVENSLLSSLGFTNDTYLDNRDDLTSDAPEPILIRDLQAFQGIPGQVTIAPAVADGYWLAVDVQGGDHTLNFGGTLSVEGEPFFALDITYNILNPIYGTPLKNNLNGTKGNDYIDGGDGPDKLMGLKGDDLIVGGDGADVIDGGKSNDELWGDGGLDTFIFKRNYGNDIIFDFESGEIVELKGFSEIPNLVDLELPSGVNAAKLDFGQGDILTFVNVASSDLSVNLDDGTITL